MRGITKWFNVMIQSWNTIFFGFLAFGGFYLLTKGNFIAGAILLLRLRCSQVLPAAGAEME